MTRKRGICNCSHTTQCDNCRCYPNCNGWASQRDILSQTISVVVQSKWERRGDGLDVWFKADRSDKLCYLLTRGEYFVSFRQTFCLARKLIELVSESFCVRAFLIDLVKILADSSPTSSSSRTYSHLPPFQLLVLAINKLSLEANSLVYAPHL